MVAVSLAGERDRVVESGRCDAAACFRLENEDRKEG
jgi:hypothetical protein